MFHELHCLRRMRATFTSFDPEGWDHIQHCLNYLREMVLCKADITLERGDFMTRNMTEVRLGATHLCRDWEAIYDQVGLNWLQWYHFMENSNFTASDFST
ncbi:hypothetical protein K435DRAFT_781421 [Dendrothele bispora CBS 962.96]|uniref:Uncharacterized protein n=1 Tax=Dendrothele bispora (strain CBS 962.96) TaxID=1314807 RepID=A0A4S8LLP7_DENBC|nr:hypothetical protein K435DRAFT_781421 [Dendrothele bispora CBS 962.96]